MPCTVPRKARDKPLAFHDCAHYHGNPHYAEGLSLFHTNCKQDGQPFSNQCFIEGCWIEGSLFVFSICGPKQNATSLLTSVTDTVFNALSHGTLGFAVHGSFFNHFLIGQHFSTTNQNL